MTEATADAAAKPLNPTLGIDLGADTTRLAYLQLERPMPTIVRNELSNEATHTMVTFGGAGDGRCYGESAASKQITKAKETVVDLATWLYGGHSRENQSSSLHDSNLNELRHLSGVELHAVQVAAYFIKSMLRLVEQHPAHVQHVASEAAGAPAGDSINHHLPVCVAVPAVIGPAGIAAVRECCLLAGIPQAETFIAHSDEAVAVYMHHLHYANLPSLRASPPAAPAVVVILDVGQSSMCGCVLQASQERLTKVATHASGTGSGDIDIALCGYVYEEIAKKHAKELSELAGCHVGSDTLGFRGNVKVWRKLIRECKKTKEVLSSVEEANVQLEGLVGDLDIVVPVSRRTLDHLISPILSEMREMLIKLRDAALAVSTAGAPLRIEVIGGGWRTTCVAELIKHVFQVERLGVSLDPSLAVAEGAAILAALCAYPVTAADADDLVSVSADEAAGRRHAVHRVVLERFELTDPRAVTAAQLSEQQEAAVVAWAAMELKLAEMDQFIKERLQLINELDSFVLQTLDALTAALTPAADATEEAKASLASRAEAGQQYLHTISDYISDDCHGDPKELVQAKLEQTRSHMTAYFPELAAYYAAEEAKRLAKEEALRQLSDAHAREVERGDGDDGDSLKTDPQRLRMAQRRREQGQALFKEECWAEAQKRFVQALAVLGQLYDLKNPETLEQRRAISLSCHLNIASCSIKLQLWRNALNNSNSVLELSPDHPKGLFRRGQARLGLQELPEAVGDLQRAADLSQQDAAVVAELNRAKEALEKAEGAGEEDVFEDVCLNMYKQYRKPKQTSN
ncbi:heat shock protein 110kDa [Strigomonas culicis]|uniref:Heat shock protein 110kDa n=1 Tax=Strigomonas culicis TaxID=28005 RepID=S9W726_9TRYP|nr:heat shock protein 110kDa [Strigomonas culicis]|eukprot:EPY31750.1 heat shock protein 110kDa [Strigomonas culicis]